MEPNLVIRCHRVVVAAFSKYLKNKFAKNPDPHTVILADGIKYNTLFAIISLIYKVTGWIIDLMTYFLIILVI